MGGWVGWAYRMRVVGVGVLHIRVGNHPPVFVGHAVGEGMLNHHPQQPV